MKSGTHTWWTKKLCSTQDKRRGRWTDPGATVVHGDEAVEVEHVWALVQLGDDMFVGSTVTRRLLQTVAADTAVLRAHITARKTQELNLSQQSSLNTDDDDDDEPIFRYSSKTYDTNALILDATKSTWSRLDCTCCAYYTHIIHSLDVTTST